MNETGRFKDNDYVLWRLLRKAAAIMFIDFSWNGNLYQGFVNIREVRIDGKNGAYANKVYVGPIDETELGTNINGQTLSEAMQAAIDKSILSVENAKFIKDINYEKIQAELKNQKK